MNKRIVPLSKPYIVLMCDPIIHTELHPFCSQPDCPCHNDAEAVAELLRRVTEGEITGGQALNIYWDQVR